MANDEPSSFDDNIVGSTIKDIALSVINNPESFTITNFNARPCDAGTDIEVTVVFKRLIKPQLPPITEHE